MTVFLAFEDQMPIQTTPLDLNSSIDVFTKFSLCQQKRLFKATFLYQTWIEQVKDLNLLENRDV